MSGVVLLDTGPLGLVTNPRGSKETENCGRWLQQVVTDGATVMVPEIADYELRRELLRAKKTKGIARLDKLIAQVGYLPITTKAMRQAATYWPMLVSRARQRQTIRNSTAM